jgi:hypothetical protein
MRNLTAASPRSHPDAAQRSTPWARTRRLSPQTRRPTIPRRGKSGALLRRVTFP